MTEGGVLSQHFFRISILLREGRMHPAPPPMNIHHHPNLAIWVGMNENTGKLSIVTAHVLQGVHCTLIVAEHRVF